MHTSYNSRPVFEYACLLCGMVHPTRLGNGVGKHALSARMIPIDTAGRLLLVHAGRCKCADVEGSNAVLNRYLPYSRWWEARKMWGGLLNITRNLVRQVRCSSADSTATTYSMITAFTAVAWHFSPWCCDRECYSTLPSHPGSVRSDATSGVMVQTYAWGDPEDGPLKEKIARWTIAMVYGLKMHLRRIKQAPEELRVRLSVKPGQSCLPYGGGVSVYPVKEALCDQYRVLAEGFRRSLWGGKACEMLQDVLTTHEIEWLERQQHVPNAATQVLSDLQYQ